LIEFATFSAVKPCSFIRSTTGCTYCCDICHRSKLCF
jgi:hypothetical protein